MRCVSAPTWMARGLRRETKVVPAQDGHRLGRGFTVVVATLARIVCIYRVATSLRDRAPPARRRQRRGAPDRMNFQTRAMPRRSSQTGLRASAKGGLREHFAPRSLGRYEEGSRGPVPRPKRCRGVCDGRA
jgi:hypothetical protein